MAVITILWHTFYSNLFKVKVIKIYRNDGLLFNYWSYDVSELDCV